MRGKNGDVIDYIPTASGDVAVFLALKRAGTIVSIADRWRVPAGKSIDEGGEIFDDIDAVKASLEES